ncbi:MAG: hypothetical protein AB7O62_03445 [Pirellulales bacterium]
MNRTIAAGLLGLCMLAATSSSALAQAGGHRFFGRGPGAARPGAINRGFGGAQFFGGRAGAFGGGLGAYGGIGFFDQSPTAYYDLFWEERVPYFAMHPPVYYSAPIPRTYGYSPFAYPGEVPTPELNFGPPPETIINPHAQPSAEPTSARDQTAGGPLRLRNPYVEANLAETPGDASSEDLAQSPTERAR